MGIVRLKFGSVVVVGGGVTAGVIVVVRKACDGGVRLAEPDHHTGSSVRHPGGRMSEEGYVLAVEGLGPSGLESNSLAGGADKAGPRCWGETTTLELRHLHRHSGPSRKGSCYRAARRCSTSSSVLADIALEIQHGGVMTHPEALVE